MEAFFLAWHLRHLSADAVTEWLREAQFHV